MTYDKGRLQDLIAEAAAAYLSAEADWANNFADPGKEPTLQIRMDTAGRVLRDLLRQYHGKQGHSGSTGTR